LKGRRIYDLDSGVPEDPIVTDVCVLGAGPVGLTLTRALADTGRRVTILEIGGAIPCIAGDSPSVHFDRRVYRGATVGRAFGLGGTSALWGGQLLPVRRADLLARPQIQAPAWPLAYDDLAPYFRELQDLLDVGAGGFDLCSSEDMGPDGVSLDFTDWSPRHSRWLTFGRRNLAIAWKSHFERSPGIEFVLSATAFDWSLTGGNGERAIRELTARSRSGNAIRIRPGAVVIASGALESARTVLELDQQAGSLSSGVTEFAGRYLHDHLSLRMARVRVRDLTGFQRRFAPFFEGRTMRSLRMELAPALLNGAGLPAFYAHFLAETTEASGFAVLRDGLRSAQRRDFGNAYKALWRVPRALPDISKILYARYVGKRLAFPAGSEIFLQIDYEQAPKRENRVYLGQPDQTGRRRLHIDWDVDDDVASIARSVRYYFEQFWRRNRLQAVADLEFTDLGDDKRVWGPNLYDIYHPAGTTRMTLDPSQGVVDPNLRIHGTRNAYVVGSAVFPSMGAANPTFTAMALAVRLAHLLRRDQ
jgi:choline dehydrogenase-like flavoprotein